MYLDGTEPRRVRSVVALRSVERGTCAALADGSAFFDGRGRPLLEPPLRALLADLVARFPAELGHVDASRILLVAGAARRSTRASIRPLTFGGDPPGFEGISAHKPRVLRGGRLMLYELCLRPRFFLRASPEERLEILVHELWHISSAFDGSLEPSRRHAAAHPREADGFARAVASRARDEGLDARVLFYDGELRAPMWLDRPPSLIPSGLEARRAYDEHDLYLGILRQRSDKPGRPDAWARKKRGQPPSRR